MIDAPMGQYLYEVSDIHKLPTVILSINVLAWKKPLLLNIAVFAKMVKSAFVD